VIRDSKNIIPVSMALLLHVIIFTSMIIAFDYSRPTPFTPLAVKATLVQEVPEKTPPPAPVVEPEPEPVVVEPEPEPEPEPDNSEELRRVAEEEKRRQDALIEQKRLEELKRREEEDRKRKAREEAERKKREEEEKERQRVAAEQKRQEDIRARNSAEMAAYQYAIAQKIRRNWAVPASADPETRCSVRVTQLPGGEVVGVNIISCNGDEVVRRSVEAAIRRSSPLPEPSDPDLFDRNLTLNLTLERED
jgi:colicin import membrane protein